MAPAWLVREKTIDATARRRKSRLPFSGPDALVIGLVNNMPDAELESTEKQFRDLLAAAASDLPVRLRLLALPEVLRTAVGLAQIAARYKDIATAADERIDGLIVTGAEPRAPSLKEEPFWPALVRLVDWADENTISTIWSCLAAHAAVLRLDGIERHRLPSKLSGVFKCERSAEHHLVKAQPAEWFVPHSRYNSLGEDNLAVRGYRVLSQSPETGPDIFVRQNRSLFVFLQGHLEYDRHALYREYRRDVRRFLDRRSNRYPEIPRSYFDADTTGILAEFRARALRNRCPELATEFPAIADLAVIHSWSSVAVALYRGWLAYLYAARLRSGCITPVRGAMAG